jgi:hypothetical protein
MAILYILVAVFKLNAQETSKNRSLIVQIIKKDKEPSQQRFNAFTVPHNVLFPSPTASYTSSSFKISCLLQSALEHPPLLLSTGS